MSELSRAVSRIAGWLSGVYALDLEMDLARCVIDDGRAEQLLPEGGPRTGVVVLEEDDEVWLGLYVDPRDRRNVGMLVEETSHLLCVAQHARWNRPVSLLALELQAEIDRFLFRRLRGGEALAHFRHFEWRDGLDSPESERYQTAHECGELYCRRLLRNFPDRRHVPAMLREVREFYRQSPQAKLRIAAGECRRGRA